MVHLARALPAALFLVAAAGLAAEVDPAALVEAGHFKQARAILEERLAANPRDAAALVLMAKVKLAFQDVDAATKLAEQALAADPRSAGARLVRADAISRRINDAGMFEKMRLARQMKTAMTEALSLDPRNIEAMERLMSFYLQAPSIAGGSRSNALQMADRIMALDAVRGNLAQVAIADADKKPELYEGFYLKAVRANPNSFLANVRLASLYTGGRWKNYDKAAEYAEKALQIDPTRVTSHTILATVCVAKDQWLDLDKLLARAERDVPDDFGPYYAAARTLLLAGKDLPRAEKYFRKYLSQAEPEGGAQPLAAAHWRLGQVLEKTGRRQEALREVQTAITMKGFAKQNLGEAQADLKRLKG